MPYFSYFIHINIMFNNFNHFIFVILKVFWNLEILGEDFINFPFKIN